MRRKLLTCTLAVALISLGALASEAAAHLGGPGKFSCRASAFRVIVATPPVFSEPQVANPGTVPCMDDADLGGTASVPGVASASALDARTDANPGGVPGGHADASAANALITVGATTVRASVLTARADSGCFIETGTPGFVSSSSVVGFQLNNSPPVNVSGPVTIPLGPVTIYLNRRIVSGNTVTQRAIQVTGPLGTDVAVAEAIADVQKCGS